MRQVYRKEALEHLDAADRLDSLMPITHPRGWIALVGIIVVLVGALAWSVFEKLETNVKGEGILTRGRGVRVVFADDDLVVQKVVVRPGDEVEADAPLVYATNSRGRERIVQAPVAGRVLEVPSVAEGKVNKGTIVASLEAVDAPLLAVVYVDAKDGYRIKPGMSARITPVTSSREYASSLRGRVVRAGRYPLTTQQMLRHLTDEEWVSQLRRFGPLLQVEIELEVAGQQTLYSGVPCDAKITVQTQAPIQLAMPR